MQMNSIRISHNFKFTSKIVLAGLLIAVGISTYVVKIKEAKAAGISGLTGTYSCMSNRNFAPFMNSMQNSDRVGSNFLMTLNFDNSNAALIAALQSAWNSSTAQPTTTVVSATGTFIQTAGLIPGSFGVTATFTSSGASGIRAFNVLPANSGNTLFISNAMVTGGADSGIEPETGVCQKQ
jgi:hypothetical protein